MNVYALCQWLQSTSLATWIRESLNLYPALYTLRTRTCISLSTRHTNR
jgi:hypothetical protein